MKEIQNHILPREFCWGRGRLKAIALKWQGLKCKNNFVRLQAMLSFLSAKIPRKSFKTKQFLHTSTLQQFVQSENVRSS